MIACLFALSGMILFVELPHDDEADEKLPAGLIATYRDSEAGGAEVWRIEPALAFSLMPGQSPHPRIQSGRWTGHWRGQLQIFRAGRYKFSAELSGGLKLRIAGQPALEATVNTAAAQVISGKPIEIEAGWVPIEAEFSTVNSPGHLKVYWSSDRFSREPLRWDTLHHRASERTGDLVRSMQQDRGRFLVEELSCVACHRPDDDDPIARALGKRLGPDLSRIGERAFPGWLDQWLANPQRFRAQAVMPHLFADGARGRAERRAVVAYLATLGGEATAPSRAPSSEELRNYRRRGERLYHRIGCSVCHEPAGGKPAIADLKHMGSKWTHDRLAQYLQNPLALDPSGRMPNMNLDGDEARDLAHYLCESVDDQLSRVLPGPDATLTGELNAVIKQHAGPEAELLAGLPDAEKWRAVGERLIVAKGCTNCHRVAPGGKELAGRLASVGFSGLRARASHGRGCLADRSQEGVPHFVLASEHRDAIGAFLRGGSVGSGAEAPTFSAGVSLRRFQCVACHARTGLGGLTSDQTDQLRQYESAQDAESIQPPPLTEVGAKLRTSYLKDVLTASRRARPWMALRMPQFGPENVAHLATDLALADGVQPTDDAREFPYDANRVEAGRFLVGKKGFGCISCHDIAGQPNTGTRGPDLAAMHQRVRFDWYTRWLDDPQRMQPGTRMPTVFQNGTTAIKTVLDGHAGMQSQAIWEYLSLGANLPLPEGMEPPRGLVIEPKDRPIVVRTFMPDAGNRAIAVGFPDSLSFAFDPGQGRLAYAWTGQFLDAEPIWQNRGGFPAGVRGPRLWTAPSGCPWEVGDSPAAAPDWGKRTADPSLGANLIEGQAPGETARIQFQHYSIDSTGNPAFHYAIRPPNGDEGIGVEIAERVRPLQKLAGAGVARNFHLVAKRGATAWLLLAESDLPIKLLDAAGESIDGPLDGARSEHSARDTIALVTGQHGIQLIRLNGANESHWIIERAGGIFRLALRVHVPESEARSFEVTIMCPHRNEPAMIRALLLDGDR